MKIEITSYPYAVQYGRLEIPDDTDPSEIHDYIVEHWEQIYFDAPDLDASGTDFEWYADEEVSDA